MMHSLFLHASNVHQGGGRTLLTALIKAFPKDIPIKLTVDERMPLPSNMASNITVSIVKPNFLSRFLIEKWLFNNVESHDVVFCFGNLPPLFKLRGRVILFIQNRYLVDDVRLNSFPPKIRLRLWLERFWLFNRISEVNELIVQTPSMANLLEKKIKQKIPINIIPFIDNKNFKSRNSRVLQKLKSKNFDFLYVASGEKHKNHKKLIDAWCLLAKEGVSPSLILTVDNIKFPELCEWIEKVSQQYQLKIINFNNVHQEQIQELYTNSNALIYPSTFESFGLPLIEAKKNSLPVIASELDYVRDILDPVQTFDPSSSSSIARSVKRYMRIDNYDLPLQDASNFMNHIVSSINRI